MVESFFPYWYRRFSSSIHLTRLGGFLLTTIYQTITLIARFFLLSFLLVRGFFYRRYLWLYLILSIRLEGFLHQRSIGFTPFSLLRFGLQGLEIFYPVAKYLFRQLNHLSELTPKGKAIITSWSQDPRLCDLARDLACDPPTSSSRSKHTLSLLLSQLVIIDLSP